ncbi:MAG: efflux RND transporter permease subunit [Magnetococcales bacterium]|nr:efflux RND transporter permease subunit [Magnetococcales bacterium]
MNLSELCIRRPVMTTLLSLALVIFGVFAYRLLPVSALPAVDYPTISVTANLPGASPETMAASVATPLEKQFTTIAGVESINSASTRGQTQITLQFDLERSLDAAALDVQSAISVAQRLLPTDMPAPPSFRKVNPANQPVIFMAMNSPTLPLSTVNEYAENLVAQRISTLPGVAQVMVYGEQKFAVRVQADPDALASREMTLDDLRKVLSGANSNTPVGSLNTASQTINLDSTGQIRRAEGFKPLVAAWRNGAPVRLSEVANVIDSVKNDKLATWLNGKRAIVMAVQRQPGSNTVAVTDAVRNLIPTFRAQLPPSIGIEVLFDRSLSIRASVKDVQFTLLLTTFLVVGVIYLFMHDVTATLVPAIVLPVSLLGTCAVMYLLGYSIDNLSLMALTLAVGFVVDDAIVMLENIVRYLEKGMGAMEAALKGAREISFTIVSITISLVAAFIPVLFMGGVIGRLFHEFAVTISVAILVSGVVSLTLTPMMCSRMFNAADPQDHGHKRFFALLLAGYRTGLDWVLGHRRFMLLVTLATLGLTGGLMSAVPKGFFPVEDTGFIIAVTEASEDTSFAAMVERQKAVAEILRNDPEVINVNSTVGAGGPNSTMNNGRAFVALKPGRNSTMQQAIQRLRQAVSVVPGITVFFQPIQNISVNTKISKSLYQYTLQAGELETLFLWAPRIEAKLKQLPGLQDVGSDLQIKSPVAMVEIDREQAAILGVNTEQLRDMLYNAFGNRQVSTIYTQASDYAVILEIAPEFQGDPGDLSRLYVRGSHGRLVPLDSFVTIKREVGPASVNHLSQLPAVTLSFNLAPGAALGDAVARVKAMERELNLPATLSTSFQGTAQIFQKSLQNQGMLILAAVIVVYIVLGVLYESYAHPITILSGLPSAAVGALLTLILFGHELSVISVIGLVMLIGIVKKNAIMMIDFAIARRALGEEPLAAIREACLLRFRPIMMTTMAALMGALPIALGMGAGAELRQPLGLAVVGGLVVSQMLTLFITPVIYLYIEEMRVRLLGARALAAPTGVATEVVV